MLYSCVFVKAGGLETDVIELCVSQGRDLDTDVIQLCVSQGRRGGGGGRGARDRRYAAVCLSRQGPRGRRYRAVCFSRQGT